MGWLQKFTDWLAEMIRDLWEAIEGFFTDLFMLWMKQVAGVYMYVLDQISLPDFITQYSMCSLLAAAGPTVGWAMDTFKIGEGLGMIGAAYGYRLVRKLVTLFQW